MNRFNYFFKRIAEGVRNEGKHSESCQSRRSADGEPTVKANVTTTSLHEKRHESGARVAHEWLKYAAMFVMLLTLGSGNAWGATQAVPLGTYYKLSSTTIPHNDAYILKFTGNYILCNSNAGTNYITQNSYGSDPNSITITNDNKQLVWNVVNYSSGSFTLRGPNGEAYSNSNKTASVAANGSTWTISSNYLVTGSFYMKWVSASGFRCYNTSGNRTTLNAVYKKAVAAASSNTTYGTVSISGDVVTATPTSGYRVSTSTPYTISPSNKATVSQSGNVFTLSSFSDTVRITINFEASAPACTAPDHVTITGAWDKFAGEDISLTATPYDDSDNEITTGITGYQWQKLVSTTWTNVTGANVSGATSNNLVITNCTTDNSGKYRCVISTGETCSTASATATDGTEGYGVKVYVLECYTGGTTVYNFTRDGNNQRGSVEVTLSASTAYAFKVHGDTEYFGNNGIVNEDVTNWECTTAQASNLTVNSGLGGTFTFTMDYSSGGNNSTVGIPELSITYPRKTIYLVPNSDWLSNSAKFAYYYYSASGANDWTDFIAANACGMTADIPQWNGITVIAVRFNSSEASPGWNGDGHVWNQTDDIALTADKNLITITGWNNSQTYGTYSPTTYQITFAGNGNSSGSMTNVTSIPCGEDRTLAANAFVKTGHTFANWKTNVAITVGGSPVAADGAVANQATINSITSDITLTAQWNVNSHTLTWNWNGGSTSSTTYTLYPATSGSVNYGASITKPANNTMSKTGYNFTSWSSNATTMPDDNLTIAANWTAKTYDLTLDPDGGSGSNQTVTATYDATMPTTLKGGGAIVLPTKTGYTFGGYYSAKNGGGTQYYTNTGASARTWNVDDEITLYAKWTINSHILTWNWGGGSCSGTAGTHYTAGGSLNYGTAISYPDDSYMSKAGYTFTGWSSDATTMPDDDLTITATWTAKNDTYKTALHTSAAGWTTYASGHTESGGGYTIPNPGSVAKGATSTCEDTHYHFVGWVTDANKEAGTISGNIIAATGTTDATGTTYWAVWEKEATGGAGSIELDYNSFGLTTSYAEKTATVSSIGFTINQGYKGSGNCIQMNSTKGSGILYNTTPISGLDSIKLYCTSSNTGKTATIYRAATSKSTSSDSIAGTAACASSTNYKVDLNTAGKTGDYFTLKVGGATYFSKIEVYYSTFEDPKVECEACAATPSITSVDLTSGTYSLTSVPVQATGASAGTNCSISSYGFYWGTSENPTSSDNTQSSTDLSSGTFSATLTGPFSVGQTYHYRAFATNNGGYTGYSSDATFTLRSVTFDLNGHGSSAPSVQYVNNGGKATDPSYSESVTGYRFVGWYDEAACRDGHEWVFNTNTVSGDNATIYAKWLPDPTVTFSVPTGVDAISSQRASVNLPTPSGFPTAISSYSDQWAFAGWTESSSVNSTSAPATLYPAGAPYTGEKTTAFTLYAVYSRNKYLVVYNESLFEADEDYIITTWKSDNYALTGTANGNNAEVADMDDYFHDKVLGGLHYYTLDNPTENAVWHLTGTTDNYVLQNKVTGKYLDLSSTSSPMISDSEAKVSIKYDDQTFAFYKSTDTLTIVSTGASVTTNPSSVDNGEKGYYFLYKKLSTKYMTTPAEPTFNVTWKITGQADSVSVVNAYDGLTAAKMHSNPSDDYLEVGSGGCIPNTKGKFVGWSATNLGSEDGQGAPADLFTIAANAPYLTKDTTLYAVFAEASGGGTPFYGLVEDDADATEGTYLIVYNGTYAMGSHHDGNNVDTYSDYSDISSYYDGENKRIASNGTTDALAYIAEKTTNGYSLKHSETISSVATDVYLGCSINNNKGLRWDYPFTASTDEWLLAAGSVNSVGQSSRYIRWNNTSGQERFATYLSSSVQDIQLYKYNSGVTYSNYRTSCCATTITFGAPSITGEGTVVYTETSGVPTCEGDTSVTVTITPAAGYQATAITFGGTAARKDTVPDVSTPLTAAQAYTIGYAQGVSGTLTTSVTFAAKPLTGWTWKYKKDADAADGSVEPYDIPATVEIYKDQYARFIITGYTPADVIADKQGYVYTSGGVEPYYSTDYLARVAGTASYFTLRGKAPVESTTITFKAIGDASITKTITIKVNALPAVHFTDIVHGESFADVAASVTTGVVTFTNTTPTHADIAAPGSSNTCENEHLHLIGWIYSEWSGVADYMDNTGDAPDTDDLRTATVGTAEGFDADNTPCYFEAGASIDTQVWNGKTFYAVWAKVE